MRISIIGGGNMGSILAARFSQENAVTVFLNEPYEMSSDYSKNLIVLKDNGSKIEGKIFKYTNNLSEAIKDAEWIFITFPSFLFEPLSEKMIPLLQKGQHLVGIPGSGAFELFFMKALDKGCTLSGLQRAHCVARIIEKGKLVRESGVRNSIRVSSIPRQFNEEACRIIGDLFSMKVELIDCYLNITLINSNPILHTSRLYSLFKDYFHGKEYPRIPLFYEEWCLDSSKQLIAMDNELFNMFAILKKHGIIVDQIETLLDHYESQNAEQMTKKINSINSLKGLSTPSIQIDNGNWIPDLNSRYFTADFPLGLDILLSFAEVTEYDAKQMRTVSEWYHNISNSKKMFSLSKFGIDNIDDLKGLYLK